MSIFYIETQMKELREQLSHSKRIGCFFGAGTSMAMGLPGIVSLTEQAIEKLEGDDKVKVESLLDHIKSHSYNGSNSTIEDLLNYIRMIRQVTYEKEEITHLDINGKIAVKLDRKICKAIHQILLNKEDEISATPTGLLAMQKFIAWYNWSGQDFSREIFTLNYDLLLFWVLMKFNDLEEQNKFIGDKDCRLKVSDGFGNSLYGNNDEYVVYKNNDSNFYQTIHYLHGALHIFDKESEIIKNTYSRTERKLRQQTLDNLEKSIYPIFISEGTANNKKARIIHNSYLNNSFKTLRTLKNNDSKFKKENSIIIFGTTLKSNDNHIIEAIVESGVKNIFIGISSLDKKSELLVFEEYLANKKITLQYYDYKTLKVWR